MYEEAIQTVTTVRDFGQVFDAYAQFEESMISSKMETAAEMGASEEGVCVGCILGGCVYCVKVCAYFVRVCGVMYYVRCLYGCVCGYVLCEGV